MGRRPPRPREGVSIAHKFVNSGAAGIVGHFNSSVSIPASTVYAEAGVVQITPASTNPKLTEQGFSTVFRVCGRDDQQGEVAANYIVDKLKLKRVAILHDKTTYGQGLADETKRFLEKRGVKPVFYSGVVQGDKDYTPVLTAAKQKNPELVYFGGIHPEAILLVKQMRERLGMKAHFMSGDGIVTDEYYKIAGNPPRAPISRSRRTRRNSRRRRTSSRNTASASARKWAPTPFTATWP